ncbi:hypothetical protein CTAYLR_000587 [Chrysophaeum taylorii]|uniref:EGF-like domain-containing protein n=1 Tax=Chrysophaeum taylorii TaxID=2483200 RepID=A0AAD7XNL5_9STRA|nr:hypothetical protein CTAYLR_000587 [Chrysophaeum taylorii]
MACVGALLLLRVVGAIVETRRVGCAALNYCNGHGRCVAGSHGSPSASCACFEGWGSPKDLAIDRMLDCSQRTCPGVGGECSRNGLCDRISGTCACFDSWVGDACATRGCPNECSGRGQCLSMAELARREDALPLHNATTYAEWDAVVGRGCLCDSAWEVGLGPGQRRLPEWFGPDCSLRRCPSGDDPMTRRDETDCANVSTPSGRLLEPRRVRQPQR